MQGRIVRRSYLERRPLRLYTLGRVPYITYHPPSSFITRAKTSGL